MTTSNQLAQRRGDYGFDAPFVPIVFTVVGIASLGCAALSLLSLKQPTLALVCLLFAVYMLLSAASYIYTTRTGKLRVWSELLTSLRLRGNEQAVDLGCGRGAVLLMAAQLLPAGKITGVDLWRSVDQSGNDPAVTRRNAEREGVPSDRFDLVTADIRKTPLPDASFDLVVSSMTIHNIHAPGGRTQAIDEAVRILKPGGRLVITDLVATAAYAARLRELGMANVERRGLGWRFWYGSPFFAAKLVMAQKPA